MLAGAEGFEPPTAGFGDQCSSQTELRSCEQRKSHGSLKIKKAVASPAALNHTLTNASRTNNGLSIFICFLPDQKNDYQRLKRITVLLTCAHTNHLGYWRYEYLPIANLPFTV